MVVMVTGGVYLSTEHLEGVDTKCPPDLGRLHTVDCPIWKANNAPAGEALELSGSAHILSRGSLRTDLAFYLVMNLRYLIDAVWAKLHAGKTNEWSKPLL